MEELKELFAFVAMIVIPIAILFYIIVGWIVPSQNHYEWERCRNFCETAQGFHTNETLLQSCECRRLDDHSLFYVDKNNGRRFIIQDIQ